MPTTREERMRLERIIESAMDAIITVDEQQRIVLFNRAAETMFGVTKDEALGGTLDRFLPGRYRRSRITPMAHFGGITQEGEPRLGGRTVYGRRANGEEFPMDASISEIDAQGQRYYTVILRDVTGRVRAERALQQAHTDLATLSRAASRSLEDQRRRIARELHDELGQMLTAMKIDVTDLQSQLPAESADLRERCEQLRVLIDQTIAATRRMATELRPLVLDDLGLAAAVDWLAEAYRKRTGLRITVRFDEAIAHIGEPYASAVFRIVQESLTNIVRHAQAASADIEAVHVAGEARVVIKDDGRGIRAEDMRRGDSFGLLSIRERARLMGGIAEIGPRPDGGTRLRITFPYRIEEQTTR